MTHHQIGWWTIHKGREEKNLDANGTKLIEVAFGVVDGCALIQGIMYLGKVTRLFFVPSIM